VLIIFALALSLAATGPGTLSVDLSISRFIQDHQFFGSGAITDLGNAIGTAFVGVPVGLALAGFFAWKGWRRAAYLMLAATALRVINSVLKEIFDSPRPSPEQVEVHDSFGGLGFPSGHVSSVTLLCSATLLILWPHLNRRQRAGSVVAWPVLVVATAYARVNSGAHWPTDSLGGMLWALVLFAIPAAIYVRSPDRDDENREGG
jgi:undecaprenyl-diphosphatase